MSTGDGEVEAREGRDEWRVGSARVESERIEARKENVGRALKLESSMVRNIEFGKTELGDESVEISGYAFTGVLIPLSVHYLPFVAMYMSQWTSHQSILRRTQSQYSSYGILRRTQTSLKNAS